MYAKPDPMTFPGLYRQWLERRVDELERKVKEIEAQLLKGSL